MDYDDYTLVEMYLRGDSDAFEVIVERYSTKIFRYIFSITRDHDTAEELTQDVFVKVWSNLRGVKRGNAFQSWIFTIAKHTTFDFLRISRRASVAIDFTDLDLASPADYDTAFETEISLESERIYNALVQLNHHEHSVLILYYYEHFTLREVADILEMPINTAKSIHLRAIKKLKSIIQQ